MWETETLGKRGICCSGASGGTLALFYRSLIGGLQGGVAMKGLFKSKPRTPVEVVRQTRDLLIYANRSSDTRESKREEKVCIRTSQRNLVLFLFYKFCLYIRFCKGRHGFLGLT